MHRRRCAAAWVCFAVMALAASATPTRAQTGTLVAAKCPESAEARYFPVGTFTPESYENADLTLRQWYSNHLAAMAEPSLSCGELDGDEVYRFLVIPHFRNSITVRIDRIGDVYSLRSILMKAGHEPYRPGPVAARIAKTLTPEQSQAVHDRLERINFWSLKTLSVGGYGGVRDGSTWILEARREGRYHVVNRGTGDTTLPSLGRLFFDLAGINTQPDEFDEDGTSSMVFPF